MLNMFAVHRRPALWDNPEGFDPTRFDPQRKNGKRFAYFPFSDGPRTCLGERFAILESMIVLAGILGRFDLQLLPGQNVERDPMITLRPRGPLLMRLTRSEEHTPELHTLMRTSYAVFSLKKKTENK